MTLENLARIGRLYPHAPTREEIGKLLRGAARSLKDARNAGNSNASRLTLAYTAIMEAAQAALFANGYRPSKSEGGHHMTMVQSLVHTIGIEPARMRVLDTIRHKRNAGEMYFGAENGNWGEARRQRLENALRNFVVIPYDHEIARCYGRLVAERKRIGRPIAPNDAWIAACAARHQVSLVTHNRRDFVGIAALTIISESPA